jgi:hypothetical protein
VKGCSAVKIFRWIISGLYSAATLIAVVAAIIGNLVPLALCIVMGAAAVSIIVLNIGRFEKRPFAVLLPLAVIHICAYANGAYMGDNNILHHLVRLVVSTLVFVLFFLSDRKNKANT